jgi:benzoate-CoA ligase family protein
VREGRGGKVAVRFGNRVYTYGESADRAAAFARYLAARGVAEEQRVFIALPDSPAFVWVLFGALGRGAVVAMGNPDAPPADLAEALDYVRATALVTVPRVARALGPALRDRAHLAALVLVPEVPTGGDVDAEPDVVRLSLPRGTDVRSLVSALTMGERFHEALPSVDAEDGAIWLFTSGSTGRPKAAMHRHGDFVFSTEAYAKSTLGYRAEDVTVSVPRLFFGYATGANLIFPFAVGGTVGLFAERPTADSLTKAIDLYRPTIVVNVPTMMSSLLDHDDAVNARDGHRIDASSVRFHISAGEALPPSLHQRFTERFGVDVYDGIGSAEMFHIYATNRPADVRPGSLGKPVDGYTLRVLPAEAEGPGARPLAANQIGVLWVKGESAAIGYYRDRAASIGRFHGEWCRTGDLFRIDDEGYLWFEGRADDLMKVGGQWVSPVEVAQCLMSHPAVALCAVVGVADRGLTKPHAFVVLREPERPRLGSADAEGRLRAELQEYVKSKLARHKYPRSISFVDDLPKNDRGKIDRTRLQALLPRAT